MKHEKEAQAGSTGSGTTGTGATGTTGSTGAGYDASTLRNPDGTVGGV